MKYLVALTISYYYLPGIGSHISCDMLLGIVAGALFAAFIVAIMYVKASALQQSPVLATVRKPRRMYRPANRPVYVFVPTNYGEWINEGAR